MGTYPTRYGLTKIFFIRFYNFKYCGHSLTMFRLPVWSWYCSDQQGWFRIFGKGIGFKHKSKELTFSQRFGFTKYFKIGNWILYQILLTDKL